MLSRRGFIKGAAVAAVGTMVGVPARPAVAGPSAKVSRQVPGYFRLPVGDIEVTALYDGGVTIPAKILHGATPQEIDVLLRDACIDPEQGLPTAINAFLVNTGNHLLLVDTGAGTAFGDKGGLLPGNIRAAGYDPREIGVVLLTHLHSDHALGLTDGAGRAVFPQARVRAAAAEAAYWLGPDAEQRIPEAQRKMLPAIKAALAPYQEAGRFSTFAPGETPAQGVEAVALAGHTPGHTGYRLASKGQGILFWGDIVHGMAVQFPRPEVSIDFDIDQPAAVATRTALMKSLAKGNEWVAGAHLPFPGLGHLRQAGAGYAWCPALYAG
ncbi:conserved hypothetical protein [Solidesulfovibrio fructosivorans JJ]]|uniref:Metallo-beta-lactamase domain-containing protein n=1 Tax=Solidesulfovibrio fructosivorans JJ] TaxID=596151 RepID=E1JY40_SOLFR|nr:MBL fold metallo-hydrolase [Solidesulfovibrio fructosivorans]EFL50778.1 conserved hypothetical protein [Solidesulfovibrio fructosivorans JJ]]